MKEIIKELAGWLLYIVLIIAFTWCVVTFVGQRTEVSGSSMETTLSDKDQPVSYTHLTLPTTSRV